jgi:hypothetical protein
MQEGTMGSHRLERHKLSPLMITAEHLLSADKNVTKNSHLNPNA